MSRIVSAAVERLRDAIDAAFAHAVSEGHFPEISLPDYVIEIPAEREHGDFAANAAMVSARALRLPPRKIAELIVEHISLNGTMFDRVEIAGPGFLNFFLSNEFYVEVLKDVRTLGEEYGHSDYGQGKKVMIEFVSANPTGPMHLGNARGGALGDCLAGVMDAAGFDVWREFYVNDAGNQIEKFGYSLEGRYLQLLLGEDAVEFQEDWYQGEDITELAQKYIDKNGNNLVTLSSDQRRAVLVDFAMPRNLERMKEDLRKYRIEYDKWFLESTLHNSGAVDETIELLTKNSMTYEKDGAIWYKATEKGAEKDEVLVRQNGHPTYFAADIAYHRNKFARGFELLIDIWGADHHGHVARMKGALDAVGENGDNLKVILMQLVRLVKDGEPVRMSKRTGKAIQLRDLLDEVPPDAARFIFNMREANSQMEFDLDLAVQQDNQNPVYYVQYAHARICSILKALAAEGIAPRECTDPELDLLSTPEERELIRHIASYTGEIADAARDFEPSRVTRYVITLATLFHKFYNSCRVKGEIEGLAQARLTLCLSVQTIIRNVLTMFKITIPESM